MLKAGVAALIVVLAPAAVAQPLVVAAGTSLTFALAGTPPRPGPARRKPIGPADPAPGEITVGLARPGNGAVTLAKLHVYDHARTSISFEATALRHGKALDRQIVCGDVDIDAWVTFPAETETVRLSDFAVAKPGCGR